jgi:hypothetical protein
MAATCETQCRLVRSRHGETQHLCVNLHMHAEVRGSMSLYNVCAKRTPAWRHVIVSVAARRTVKVISLPMPSCSAKSSFQLPACCRCGTLPTAVGGIGATAATAFGLLPSAPSLDMACWTCVASAARGASPVVFADPLLLSLPGVVAAKDSTAAAAACAAAAASCPWVPSACSRAWLRLDSSP